MALVVVRVKVSLNRTISVPDLNTGYRSCHHVPIFILARFVGRGRGLGASTTSTSLSSVSASMSLALSTAPTSPASEDDELESVRA